MTRVLPLLIAASLLATPTLAAGFLFDLPDLRFPATDAPDRDGPVTQSTPVLTGPAATPEQD